MKQWKKTIAFVLSLAMILTGIQVSPDISKAAATPKFYGDVVTAQAGDEVSVTMKVSGNPGIMGFKLMIGFDKDVLTPVDDITATSLLAGTFVNGIGAMKEGDESFPVLWSSTGDMTEDGELFTMKFKVAENAKGSTQITTTLSQPDTFNENMDDVAFDCEPITVNIGNGGEIDTPTETPEDTPTEAPIEIVKGPKFYGDAVTAQAGDEITVTVKISENPGIMGFKLFVGFDKDVLTPVDDIKATSLLAGTFVNGIGAMKEGDESFPVLWSSTGDMTEDGELFTMKFKVADNATSSTRITMILSQPDTFNEELDDVVLGCESIAVNIGNGGEIDTPTETPEDKPTEAPIEIVTGPKFYGDAVTAQAGDEIAVTVKISENPGIMGFKLFVGFDKDVLTPIDEITATSLLAGTFVNGIGAMKEGDESFPVLWSSTGDMTEDGELFTMKFKVADNATGSTRITMTLSQPDTFNEELDDVVLGCQTIMVTIGGSQPDEPTEEPIQTTEPVVTNPPVQTEEPAVTNPTVQTEEPAVTNPPVQTEKPIVTNPPVQPQTPGTPGNIQNTTNTNTNNNSNIVSPSHSTTVAKKPNKIKLKSVKTAGKKKLKVSWKWDSYADGFQVQYAMNKSFTKKKKMVNVAWIRSNTTLKKLKSKKTYFVRVRSYKKVNGKLMYGSWSNVKKCKVK